MSAVRQSGAELLPIDSEHNAIFQCLPQGERAGAPSTPAKTVRKLILTASGGPFRRHSPEDLQDVTPDQACAHPNWSRGRKISVDSAPMLTKGRLDAGVSPLDLAKWGRLDFETPDLERFPCLRLSYEALRAGQAACVALNAANEIAVAAFLEGRLPYPWIARVIDAALEWQAGRPSVTLDHLTDVLALDAQVRAYAGNLGLA